MVAVVGNGDGAHKISADVFQALNDVGFTIPAGAATYWNAAVGAPHVSSAWRASLGSCSGSPAEAEAPSRSTRWS